MTIHYFKISVLLLSLAGFVLWTPLLLFVFPGSIFIYSRLSRRMSLFEAVVYSIVLSLSYWVCGFWILKLLPLSFTGFIYFSLALSFIIHIFYRRSDFSLPSFNLSDALSFVLSIFLFLLFILLYYQQIVPAGVDPATHGYIARLIQEYNGFPETYEPIVPIQRFGSSPIGFSVLTAAVSLLTNLPIYRSALLFVSLTYFLFGLALFLFLRSYFSVFISSLTTLSVLLIGSDITKYIEWGGNPSILSLAFLLFGISFGLRVLQFGYLSRKNIALLSLFLYASFTIHHIPFVTILFLFPIIGLYLVLKKSDWTKYFIHLGYLFLFLFILAIPFFLSLKLPSTETLEFIKSWQRYTEHAWVGNWKNAFITIPLYLQMRIGKTLFLLFVLGLFSAIFFKVRHSVWFFISLFIMTVLVLNSRYWFLPLSPLLYPDRIVSVGVIPLSYFVGSFYSTCSRLIQKISTDRVFLTSVFIVLVLWLPLGRRSFVHQAIFNYTNTLQASLDYSLLSEDDIKAFHWILRHTSIKDVFINNYGDAGVWIPAIAYRKVTVNDHDPYDLEELRDGASRLTPTYVYLGSRPIYSSISITLDELEHSIRYELIYSSGNARVYKIRDYITDSPISF